MTVKPLPENIQSLFCASTRIYTYKRAIEELVSNLYEVYNSLDAEATSIAIRFDIPENTIQVIDNGYGIIKTDMNQVGKKHMTSKTVDLFSLKSIPNCYGFRGQSLASLIEISQVVKITSRVEGSNQTWVKSFSKGREGLISADKTRPSKGTTVEIQGFLHNLNIQKKLVNPLTEQQDIKHFLQQLSLMHTNVSISLRDNSNNDLVFQIHKCRNIYQTFSTLFSIHKGQIQELQIEKKLYKVTAYIGKCLSDNDVYHWMYLNGRFIPPISRLHKILDNNIADILGLKNQCRKKTKNAFPNDENEIFKNIPFYFAFITCPYNDYDINESSKTLELEFKDWNNITKILEKLVKFYIGDKSLREIHKEALPNVKEKPGDARDEVKKIMEKILASNSRKLGVSQMQNGIKGKLIKRKKNKVKDISISKILPKYDYKVKKVNSPKKSIPPSPTVIGNADQNNKAESKSNPGDQCNETKKQNKILSNPTLKAKPQHKQIKQSKRNPMESEKLVVNKIPKKIKESNKNEIRKVMKAPKKSKVNILEKAFRDKPSIVKQRCTLLKNKVDRLRKMKNIHGRKITYNEASLYSNVRTKNQSITVKKRVGEIIIHESIPLPPKFHPRKLHENIWNDIQKKQCKSSYDLLQTILNSQAKNHSREEVERHQQNKIHDSIPSKSNVNYLNPERESENQNGCKHQSVSIPNEDSAITSVNISLSGPTETYESHSYYRQLAVENCCQSHRHSNGRFITKQSKDNFILGQTIRFKPHKRSHANYFRKLSMLNNLNDYQEYSYNIEFTQTNKTSANTGFIENASLPKYNNRSNNILDENMYTINREDEHMNAMANLLLNGTYTISKICMQNESEQSGKRMMNFEAPPHYEESFMDVNDVNIIEDSLLSSYKTISTIETSVARTYDIENPRKVDIPTSPQLNLNAHVILREENQQTHDLNVVFVSKSQELAKNKTSSLDMDPLNICEAILNSYELDEELNLHMKQKSIESQLHSNHIFAGDVLSIPSDAMATYNAVEETSHHFLKSNKGFASLDPVLPVGSDNNQSLILPSKDVRNLTDKTSDFERFRKDGHVFLLDKDTGMTFGASHTKQNEGSEFTVKTRARYIPKGMSPIFENCNTKNACDYELNEDYFANSMYDEFTKAVNANAEIFEENVESINKLATREINRVNERLKKDNASLCFQGEHLREAKILGQVDNKFIAAKMVGKSAQAQTMKEYLVLFDQHAAHERVRLETNLSEYLTENRWKSVALDNVTIKLKPDEILYLHNYKDKFEILGLKWTVESRVEVSVTSIPEAIIGKNARQVEIIMRAVKSLILEEIEAIKLQKGSISLYPKSIMDLVFSEACRYAIKFGDRLPYNDCVRLLSELSECKTPFQCAHGRPVMAVLMEIKPKFSVFKINMAKLEKFKKK